jgi:type I restriction enzyme M protein
MLRGRRINDRSARTPDTETRLGFEAKLWQAADALRNNMVAAEYKHVVLGLIFLKHISDAFEASAEPGRGASARAEGLTPTLRQASRGLSEQ